MNIFRLAGDLSHLAAIFILLAKIWKTRSCAGISGEGENCLWLIFHYLFEAHFPTENPHFMSGEEWGEP